MPAKKTNKTPKIAAVPRGYRRVTAQLTVADVAAASAFYADAFGAVELDRVTAPDTEVALFAQLKMGDSLILLAAADATHVPAAASAVTLHQYVEALDQIWQSALDAGCCEIAPLFDAYWGDRVGVLQDPFGYRWSLGKRIERVSGDERQARLAAIQAPVETADVAVGAAMIDPSAVIDEAVLWAADPLLGSPTVTDSPAAV